jgi:hypothetical protein
MKSIYRSIYLGILAVALTSTSCGSSNDVALDELPRELAQAYCEKAFDCCPQDSAAEFTSLADCAADFQYYTSRLALSIQESERDGRVQYDSARAGECMDEIRGLDCAQYQAETLTCYDFIVPLVALGDQCGESYECVTGYCDSFTSICTTRPALGEACSFTCDQGLYCDLGTRVCEAAKADGAECFADRECLSKFCDDTGVCGLAPACT